MRHVPSDTSDRATAVLFRMSHADKAAIQADAADLGISVQALLERRVLGYEDAVTRHGARPRRRSEEDQLPMTG